MPAWAPCAAADPPAAGSDPPEAPPCCALGPPPDWPSPGWPACWPAPGVLPEGWLESPADPASPDSPCPCEPEGSWLPAWPPLVPCCGAPEGLPPWLWDDEGELEEDPPLLGGMPPDELGEPEPPLDGELGTGMLGGLGWVMTDGVRQPDNRAAPPREATAARNLLPWIFIRFLPAPTSAGRAPVQTNRTVMSLMTRPPDRGSVPAPQVPAGAALAS
jgi:hypothetical protein